MTDKFKKYSVWYNSELDSLTYSSGKFESRWRKLFDWIFIGFLSGFIAGILLDDMSMFIILGPGGGVAIGVSIGAALEKKYNPNPRQPTPAEKRMIKILLIILTITFLLGLVVFLWQLF